MVKKLLIGLAGILLLSPALALLTVALVMTPGTQATAAGCLSTPAAHGGELAKDAPVPDEAREWIATAAQACPALSEAWIAAVMYQESGWDPEAHADDINGGTWGLFQINRHVWRGVYGEWEDDRNGNGVWDVKEPFIHAEYGATYLCNLLDDIRQMRKKHPNWPASRELTELESLVIAHNAGPGRLASYPDIPNITREYLDQVAERMRAWTAAPDPDAKADATDADWGEIPETSEIVMPLPDGVWTLKSGFGLRDDPTEPGNEELHTGIDLAAPEGTPIFAVADGVVVEAGMVGGRTGKIVIEHTIADRRVATVYMHMWEDGIHVERGDRVAAGNRIGDVGASGRVTGSHLHLEIRIGGPGHKPTDPGAWLRAHGLDMPDRPENDPPTTTGPDCGHDETGVDPDGPLPPAPKPFTGTPGGRIDDPTDTGGWVTRQTAHVVAETRRAFPDTGWSCWAERPGTDSDHPRGRACDVTVSNHIGQHPTQAQRQTGWRIANWLAQHADTLLIDYLIWDGLIWSTNRADEGWRPYNGGGMHDPGDVTGGHYDHLHISNRPRDQLFTSDGKFEPNILADLRKPQLAPVICAANGA